jgi:hypothetical protein
MEDTNAEDKAKVVLTWILLVLALLIIFGAGAYWLWSEKLKTGDGADQQITNSEETDSSLNEYESIITCDDGTQATATYQITFTSEDELVLTTSNCLLQVQDTDYQLDVQVAAEGMGFALYIAEELPDVTEVTTDSLEVLYSDDYSRDKIVRLKDYPHENEYLYTSFYEETASKCTFWEGETPAIACGIAWISLQDHNEIDSICKVTDSSNDNLVLGCDKIMETLDITLSDTF